MAEPEIEVVVTLSDAGLERIDRVVGALRAAGLLDPTVLREAGIVTGQARPSDMAALSAVDGVADIAASQGFQLGPPDQPW